MSQRLLVYDYAQGGHTLKGVRTQIDREFTPHLATKPEWAPWSEADSLFGVLMSLILSGHVLTIRLVTWVGINDCAYVHEAVRITDIMITTPLAYTDLQTTNRPRG